jgi:hypothetical protein
LMAPTPAAAAAPARVMIVSVRFTH